MSLQLRTGREGRYPRLIEADVSDERLAKFFVDEGTHGRFRQDVCNMVPFASRRVLKEPPFMRLDLLSCRNLLIYLERSRQDQLLRLFHYGLNPGGDLEIAAAANINGSSTTFAPQTRNCR